MLTWLKYTAIWFFGIAGGLVAIGLLVRLCEWMGTVDPGPVGGVIIAVLLVFGISGLFAAMQIEERRLINERSAELP